MADVARIPRRRGGLCGLLLVLLGAWAALGPFIGPYFNFAYAPDSAWHYSDGRLYLSIVPGVAALLGGLIVLATRSRAAGTFGGLLAAAGGAWLIVGDGLVRAVTQLSSLSPGAPLAHSAGGLSTATWQFLEQLGLFTGIGILIVFFAALVIGRFSMVSARDAVAADDGGYDTYPADSAPPLPASSPFPSDSTTGQFASPASQFPAASSVPGSPRPFPGDEPTETQARFPAASGQFPASPSGQFPESKQ
ncbi:MAG TPA: hypothetical protein VFV41_17325 [Streptosporangiaceae bacterium]|nr:hypothetical protein [Streptosporangiaceae bacterium]